MVLQLPKRNERRISAPISTAPSQRGRGRSTKFALLVMMYVVVFFLIETFVFLHIQTSVDNSHQEIVSQSGNVKISPVRKRGTSADITKNANRLPQAESNMKKVKLPEKEVSLEKKSLPQEKITISSKKETSLQTFPLKYFGSSKVDSKKYSPAGELRFMEWKDGDTPYNITPDIKERSDSLARERREAVKAAMKFAWDGYTKCAYGYDEINPLDCTGNSKWHGIGTTIVDSLDTLWLMGMKEEFNKGRDWVKNSLGHDVNAQVSIFETTIRSLGGLLSAYDWSGDKMFLEKAWDLGDRLAKGFDSTSGIPPRSLNLHNAGSISSVSTDLANAGTLQLEFRYLSKAIKKPEYAQKAEAVFDKLHSMVRKDGLYLENVSATSSRLRASGKITFGGGADSFYEYMLKQWLQGGKTEKKYRDMYDETIDGLHKRLLSYTNPNGLAYIRKRGNPDSDNEGYEDRTFQHLECFMGGLLALGAYTDPLGFDSERAQRDMKTAKAITYTCYQMYASTPTGLSPEAVNVNDLRVDLIPRHGGLFYMLRPETIESFYILNKVTGDPIYREWGWEIFQSLEKFCKTKYAYGHHHDVTNVAIPPENNMESFFTGELMKYLYLLMDPDSEVDLNKHVFTTEAHPMKKFDEWDA